MSVTVCGTPAALFHTESAVIDTLSAPTKIPIKNRDEERPKHSTIWTMTQSQKAPIPNSTAPYVHPLVRRSANLMSKSSLEMCTENLGSETGSGYFSDDGRRWLSSSFEDEQNVEKQKKPQQQRVVGGEHDRKQLMTDIYNCSASRRSPSPRSFPPPLPSISRSNGTCIQLRTRRHDGRLVVDAVSVAPQNYLHSHRHEGRLLISFIDSNATSQPTTDKAAQEPLFNNDEQIVQQATTPSKEINQPLFNNDEQIVQQATTPSKEINQSQEEDEDKEEVEVLDRGTMVEVKVSSQLQQPGGAKKVLRSSLVINKFVGGMPLTNHNRWAEPAQENHHSDSLAASQTPLSPELRFTTTTRTTTAAAAAVAASSACASNEVVGQHKKENRQLFTSKGRNREEMLQHMRRCSELRRPLFFWEAGSIATSS